MSEEGLTKGDKAAIRRTWALVKPDLGGAGLGLFLAMFRAYPSYQNMYSKLRGLSMDEVETSPFLKRHSLGVATALSGVIDNIENPEVMVKTLNKVVADHIPRGVTKKHYSNLFIVLLSFLGEALGDSFTPEDHTAWSKAAVVLYGIMEAKQIELGGP